MALVLPGKGADYDPPPAGSHVATCYRIVDMGTQKTSYLGVPKLSHLILISWELPEERMKDGRPFTIHKRYTYSAHAKSSLRKDLESWRGQRFADSDFGSFELDRLLGAGCMLNIVHEDKQEATYANITAIMALPRGVPKTGRETENDKFVFSLADRPFDWNGFGKLTERLQEQIKLSPEYAAAVEGRKPGDEEPPPPTSADDYGALSDDIPF